MVTNEVIDMYTRKRCTVHLLDVGVKEYGDAILCQFGEISVLIDGAHTGDQTAKEGHPSIPEQIGKLLGQLAPPYRISLLIITHAHEDHIGCLPYLVDKDLLRADWALLADSKVGWGRGRDEPVPDLPPDDRIRSLIAGLREEVRTKGTDSNQLQAFLSDAANLEERYNKMILTLEERGTRVVRYGLDSHALLIQAFAETGIKILGPTKDQLAVCADHIARASEASVQDATNIFQSDKNASLEQAYRLLTAAPVDSADATSRAGPAVNLQSIVTSFDYEGIKILFAGDMQFAKPQIKILEDSVRLLRQKIRDGAPYSFVKLSHHGSDNAFNREILEELGSSSLFGICAGERSTAHPHPATLNLLNEHRPGVSWVRTDHNGLTTIEFWNRSKPEIVTSKGELNDPKPNAVDEAVGVAPAPTKSAVTTEALAPSSQTILSPTAVEVITKVPHVSTKVTITIEVEPREGTNARAVAPEKLPPSLDSGTRDLPELKFPSDRSLSDLLFITSAEGLAENIGQAECEHLIASMKESNLVLYTHLPPQPRDASGPIARVRELLEDHKNAKGVVLLGGCDILPSQIVDCLPQSLRRKVALNNDADNFIVWSDDVYGDVDGDGLPELPVSRIPDGFSAKLIFSAIQAFPSSGLASRASIRNIMRPFADGVFEKLPGQTEILVSSPFTSDQAPAGFLEAERIYLMLHGDFADTSRFWGEDTPDNREAISLANIPAVGGAVIFTGCCWGALTAITPAGRLKVRSGVGQRTPKESIALKFLLNGARAFVGCTGSHYSPLEAPYKFFGGPLHESFWTLCSSGKPPAQALFEAKIEYIKEMPHNQSEPTAQAIEYKILRQYTCLGLGW